MMLFPETNHSLWHRSVTALSGKRCMSLSLEGEGLKLWSVPLIHDPSSSVLSRRLRRISSELLGKTKKTFIKQHVKHL